MTNSAYKQIIIAMGSGATASLGAFDYLIRHSDEAGNATDDTVEKALNSDTVAA